MACREPKYGVCLVGQTWCPAIGCAAIMGNSNNGYIVFTNTINIFYVGGFHKSVNGGIVGQFPAGKGGYSSIYDAVRSLQAIALPLVHLLLPTSERQAAFLLQGPHSLAGVLTLKRF